MSAIVNFKTYSFDNNTTSKCLPKTFLTEKCMSKLKKKKPKETQKFTTKTPAGEVLHLHQKLSQLEMYDELFSSGNLYSAPVIDSEKITLKPRESVKELSQKSQLPPLLNHAPISKNISREVYKGKDGKIILEQPKGRSFLLGEEVKFIPKLAGFNRLKKGLSCKETTSKYFVRFFIVYAHKVHFGYPLINTIKNTRFEDS